ncbi:MAG TPA: MFS transporter [Thermomicrobiales bacterium]|jgi:predicted MFS family arabinose efflux permease
MASEATTASDSAEQRRLLLILGAAIFMINLDSRVVTPLLPTIASDFRTTVSAAGSLVTAYVLPYGLFQLVYGPLADRFGKVRVVAWAMVLFSVGTALCGLPPSLPAIVALRFLTGVAAAAVFPLTLAYVGDTVPYARRQATIALLATSTAAAAAFSTAVGGLIATIVSWRFVFPIFGLISGGVTIGLLLLQKSEIRLAPPNPRPRPRDTFGAALRAPRMLPLLLLVCAEGLIYNGAFTYLGGFLHDRFALGALAIGFILAGAGVAQLGAARALPRLVRRIGERRLILLGGTLMGAAYIATVTIPNWALFLIPIVCAGAGFVLCHSTLQTRATETFPASRGTAVALFAFSLFLGNGLGSLVVGFTIDQVGYVPTLLTAGVLLWAFAFTASRLLFSNTARAEGALVQVVE